MISQGRVRMAPEAVREHFAAYRRCRIAMETGAQSAWMSRELEALGHEVIVGNAREIRAIVGSRNKSDHIDAEKLARYARVDPAILCPVRHRRAELDQDLTVIRARAVLVRMRTAAVNAIRGMVKSAGSRVGKCSTAAFAERCVTDLPAQLHAVLKPR
jgi:transposase